MREENRLDHCTTFEQDVHHMLLFGGYCCLVSKDPSVEIVIEVNAGDKPGQYAASGIYFMDEQPFGVIEIKETCLVVLRVFVLDGGKKSIRLNDQLQIRIDCLEGRDVHFVGCTRHSRYDERGIKLVHGAHHRLDDPVRLGSTYVLESCICFLGEIPQVFDHFAEFF